MGITGRGRTVGQPSADMAGGQGILYIPPVSVRPIGQSVRGQEDKVSALHVSPDNVEPKTESGQSVRLKVVKSGVVSALRFCKDCLSRDSWERYPERDWKYESGKVYEYAYRCRQCGAVTLRPYELP